MEYLYHGSITQNLKTLEPRKRYTPAGKIEFAAIYATPLTAYAAAHSFPWSSEEGVKLEVINSKVFLKIPSKFKEKLESPVSIYKISTENFEHTKEEKTGYTWHSVQPTKVLEEIKYENVLEALKMLGVEVAYS
jgi:hypothetical protein